MGDIAVELGRNIPLRGEWAKEARIFLSRGGLFFPNDWVVLL